MASAPIILVPGFWLGAWAWDEVAGAARADGHDVTAMTLPGLESQDADRSAITFEDHVDAIVAARRGRPSGRSCSPSTARAGSAATPRATASRSGSRRWSTSIPRPGSAPLDAARGRQADGLGGDRGGGEPRRPDRGAASDVPRARRAGPGWRDPRTRTSSRTTRAGTSRRTIIATGYTAEAYQNYAKEHPDWAFLAGIPELRNVTWIDLPTSHWPMWSKPARAREDHRRRRQKAGEGR